MDMKQRNIQFFTWSLFRVVRVTQEANHRTMRMVMDWTAQKREFLGKGELTSVLKVHGDQLCSGGAGESEFQTKEKQ